MLLARPHHAKQLVSRINGQTIPGGTSRCFPVVGASEETVERLIEKVRQRHPASESRRAQPGSRKN
jgi:hypothetical protein